MPCKLSVNVNAIAYLRNRRHVPWPSVTDLCRVALDNGAVGITVHPRPDERHIRRTDVTDINRLSEYSHTLGLQRGGCLVNALLVARTKSDMRSVRRKIISAAPANALAAAGDEYA